MIENNPSLFSDIPFCTTLPLMIFMSVTNIQLNSTLTMSTMLCKPLFQQEVTYLLENGLAVPSSSAWSSLCLLVPNTNKTPCFCTDFRKVNVVTKADLYSLPRTEDCVDRVGSAKFVTKLDLLKILYWQVLLIPVHLRFPLLSPQTVAYCIQEGTSHFPAVHAHCTCWCTKL